ncbi:DNA polymerase, partial [Henriciella sp.]|uniref:DNA polymerase n=1 Tax=Henriciella sp. TaxID=1968823 RepID=UPI0025BA437E
TAFGRKLHLKDMNSKNGAMRAFSERQAINAPIQGSAADIIKRAMIEMPGALAAKKLDARMLLQVHDELVFECPEDQAEDTIAVIRRVMQKAPLPALDLSVPLDVDANAAKTWAEAH